MEGCSTKDEEISDEREKEGCREETKTKKHNSITEVKLRHEPFSDILFIDYIHIAGVFALLVQPTNPPTGQETGKQRRSNDMEVNTGLEQRVLKDLHQG